MPQSQDEFLSNIEQSLAMWADENLFGHDIEDDEKYELACARLADELHETAYVTLRERPVR